MIQAHDVRTQCLQNLYKDLSPIARSYLKKRGCNEADGEDFLQEAFLRLLSKQRYIPEGLELSYLIRMLRNLIIDDFRRKKSQRLTLRSMDESAYDVPAADDRDIQEARQLLWIQLGEAAHDPRASAFLLQVRQGLSLEEIAAAQNAPVGTIAAQISRYRGQFKGAFQKAWECSVWC